MTVALVTGGRDFCEQRPGADHMGERRALGFALDWVRPTTVHALEAEIGPARIAKIYTERRGIAFSVERSVPDCLVAFPGASQRAIDRANELGIDIYEVGIK